MSCRGVVSDVVRGSFRLAGRFIGDDTTSDLRMELKAGNDRITRLALQINETP